MRPQRRNVIRSPAKHRGRLQSLLLFVAFLLASPPAVWAGGIIGTVRDATTSAPLGGFDLDVWDPAFLPAGVTTLTAVDGTYNIPLPSGQYYLRVDPTNAQLYVDQFYPGVFLKSGAQLVTVPAIGNVTVNFNLHLGGTISGHVFDQVTSAPILGVDLDVFVFDTTLGTREFVGSINAATDVAGAYSLGRFPPGTYYVRAQPAALLFHQTRYYSGKFDLATANALVVSGLGDIPNLDFNLPAAGAVTGLITKSDAPASPLTAIDLDLYDATGKFVRDRGR